MNLWKHLFRLSMKIWSLCVWVCDRHNPLKRKNETKRVRLLFVLELDSLNKLNIWKLFFFFRLCFSFCVALSLWIFCVSWAFAVTAAAFTAAVVIEWNDIAVKNMFHSGQTNCMRFSFAIVCNEQVKNAFVFFFSLFFFSVDKWNKATTYNVFIVFTFRCETLHFSLIFSSLQEKKLFYLIE